MRQSGRHRRDPLVGTEYDRDFVSAAIVLQRNRTRINRDAIEFS